MAWFFSKSSCAEEELTLISYASYCCRCKLYFFIYKQISKTRNLDSRTPNYLWDLNCDEFFECSKIKDLKFAACYCDSHCHYYNDCCPEVTKTQHQHSGLHEVQSRTHQHSEVHDDIPGVRQDMLSCVEYKHAKTSKGIYAVVACKDINTKCYDEHNSSDIENILFVTDDKNITYRNSKCARCNGVSTYSYWLPLFPMEDISVCIGMNDTSIDIKQTIDLNTPAAPILLFKHGCKMDTYPPPAKSVRFCIHSIKDVENCSSNYGPVRKGNVFYLNAECCRRDTDDCTENTAACVRWVPNDEISPFDEKGAKGQLRMLPSSVLFEFTGVCMYF